ncbi:MAG TPA: HAMP domain-containing sensor histidine kinase [Solirubrobacteraceae bacterium]
MRSLRGRLTLGITLVLAIVLAVAGVVVSRDVDATERAALDDRLKRTAELSRETALRAVESALPSNDGRIDQVLSATRTSLRILFAQRVVLESGQAPPGSDRRLPRDGLHTFSAGGERYRSYGVSLDRKSREGLAQLEVTTALRGLERRQDELNARLFKLAGAALLLAGVGAWFAANFVLRPLSRLRAATSTIASTEDLDQRVSGDDGPAELRSLAKSFNDMLARLGRSAADRERALAATRRFAADAGHELRTPLTSVHATLSALHRHPDVGPQQRAELLRDALGEQRRLVDLLDGLQALARGDAPELERTRVDLTDLVASLVGAAAGRHPAITWTWDLPEETVSIRGWEPGLRILVDNLLENAARHGRCDGAVHVSLQPAGPVLVVDDDGPGVADEERGRIFEPFVRAPGTVALGSGLGLALVSQQVRAHGAEISVERSPAGGARFSVRFGSPLTS